MSLLRTRRRCPSTLPLRVACYTTEATRRWPDPESLCVPPDDYASPAAIYAAAGFVGTPAAGRAGMLGVSELALDAVAAAAGGGLAATAARCRRRRSSRFGGRRLGAGGAVPATKDLDVSSMALA
ncbi:hypothetical protein I4F81_004214 [Pyropia yezoensis]|uniref:Uncharacterized protein n=1 Tax=Pyropia yezoensis TaxID=2788 RepID=A0ACC3BVP2_PYRYE|nr:hypothetical protein I4F81_004214 [Neopyropia yezoensis]